MNVLRVALWAVAPCVFALLLGYPSISTAALPECMNICTSNTPCRNPCRGSQGTITCGQYGVCKGGSVGKNGEFELDDLRELSELESDDAISASAMPTGLTKTVELCFQFENDFSANGGDFPNGTVYYKGRGVRFKLTDSAGVISYYNADTTTGCASIALTLFGTYTVRVLSKATFADGNTIQVMNDDVNKLLFGWTATTNLVPGTLVTPSVTYTWPAYPGGSYTNNVSTVMSALLRTFLDHAITTSELYRVYVSQGPCPVGAACFDFDASGDPSLFLNNNMQDKFLISHELGHLAAYLRLGGKIGSNGGDLPNSGLSDPAASACANGATHSPGSATFPLGTEEWGNGAFNEAWAQYLSASVWNRRGDADCQYRGLDCYEPGSAFDACYTDAGLVQTLDTGFERDWLTTFWFIERLDGCGISFSKIVDIWVSALPRDWSHADAKGALLLAAPIHLSGANLTCYQDALNDRIQF